MFHKKFEYLLMI